MSNPTDSIQDILIGFVTPSANNNPTLAEARAAIESIIQAARADELKLMRDGWGQDSADSWEDYIADRLKELEALNNIGDKG